MITLVVTVLLVITVGAVIYLARTLNNSISSLSSHQNEMQSMADQLIALRKQTKAALHIVTQAAAETKRNANRQYRQQKKVDLILYEDQIRRERLQAAKDRGELNG